MAEGLELLQQTGQGYAPLVSGAAPPRLTGMEGVPWLGGGGTPFQDIAGMAMTPYYNRMLGHVGMTPLGVGHDRNVADVMRHMRFTKMQQDAMRFAAETDRNTFMHTAQGIAAATGTPFGYDQQQAASTLVGGMVAASPMLATAMPEFYDSLGGTKGSAAVLANRVFDAGRYRIDPLTGRMGVSSESAGFAARNIMQDLYSDQNLAQMQGITAGKLGEVYKQLQHRGMVAGSESMAGFAGHAPGSPYGEAKRALDYMGRNETVGLTRAASAAGVDLSKGLDKLDSGELDKLMAQPDVGNRMRAFDAERIKRSLKDKVDALVAMRDIFGDAGQPNAPMSQLVQGLEALTAGSMHQIDPGRLNMIVRDVHNLSRNTGVSMNGVMAMQGHAANRAAQIGVEPIFAASATNQALAWSGAYRAGGHGAHPAWGLMTADQLTQLKTNMLVNAAGSETGNRLSVLRRVSETMGGFKAGSEAAAADAALKSGRGEYEFEGKKKTLNLKDDDLIKLITGSSGKGGTPSGYSEQDVRELLVQRTQNRETFDRDNLQGVVSRMQPKEISDRVVTRTMNRVLASDIQEQLKKGGMSEAESREKSAEIAGKISASAVDRISKLSTEEFRSKDRNLHIGGIIDDELKKQGGLGMSEDDRKRFSVVAADTFYGAATEDIRNSRFRGIQHVTNWHAISNETVDQRGVQNQWQARLDSERQTALSPLGRGTIFQRMMDEIRDAKPDDKDALARILSGAMGGVEMEKVSDALRKPLQQSLEIEQQINATVAEIQKTTDPEKRAQLEEQLRRQSVERRGAVTHLSELSHKHGLNPGGITKDETSRALRANHDLVEMQKALSGLALTEDPAKRREGYDKLWKSSHGHLFRSSTDQFVSDMGNTAYRLVATPDMVERLGDTATTLSASLIKDQDRLHQLAKLHAGGDMSRLMAGDLTIDGKDRIEAMKEVGDIRKRGEVAMSLLDKQHGVAAPDITKEEKARLHAKQKAAYSELTRSGESLFRDVYKEFGVDVGANLTPQQQRVVQSMEGGVGRNMARLAIESQQTLSKVAEASGMGVGPAGVNALRWEYEQATLKAQAEKSDAPLEALRGKLKGASAADTERALKFQLSSQLMEWNRPGGIKGGTGTTDGDFEKIMSTLRSGGDLMNASSAGGAAGPANTGPQQIYGDLTIKGDGTARLDATYGAARAFSSPESY